MPFYLSPPYFLDAAFIEHSRIVNCGGPCQTNRAEKNRYQYSANPMTQALISLLYS